MGFLEDLSSGKYNLILFGIIFILFFKLFMDRKTELLTNLDDSQKEEVKQLIYNIYKVDVNAIKNLSVIANKLQEGGLTIPGDLTVTGKLNVTGDIKGNEISNKTNSLTGLKDNITNQMTNVNTNLNTRIDTINRELINKIEQTAATAKSDLNTMGSHIYNNYFQKSGGTIYGDLNINGYLTGTNFTMNTGNGARIRTNPNGGQFIMNCPNGSNKYIGAGACTGDCNQIGIC
jgi:hypothetical protein